MQDLKPLGYKETYEKLIPEGNFRISPSMVGKFTSKKHEWYRSQVLGEESFTGNTSSVLGSCVHRLAERFIKGYEEDPEELHRYIQSFKDNQDVDIAYINAQLEPMKEVLLEYLKIFGIPTCSEEQIAYKIEDGVYVAGTADAVIGNTLIDFKTTSLLTPPNYMPKDYKWQLLTYAWIYRNLGIDITRIRLVYISHNVVGRISEKTGKAMKDYPSKVVVITEMITDEDMRFIEEYLKLIAQTYLKAKQDPSLVYLLYSDYRLKEGYV